MKPNRTCMTCGKKYLYCPTCEDMKDWPLWMLVWHDENCKKIYHILGFYTDKVYTKEEAKKKLSTCNINIDFPKKTQTIIDEIMR